MPPRVRYSLKLSVQMPPGCADRPGADGMEELLMSPIVPDAKQMVCGFMAGINPGREIEPLLATETWAPA